MDERITVTLTEVELAREIARLMPVMRARGEINKAPTDISLAIAIARRLAMSGFKFSAERPVDSWATLSVAVSQRQSGD